MGRRGFLGGAGSLAAASLLGRTSSPGAVRTTGAGSNAAAQVSGRRKLGSLEVSSIGLGVQNMSRTYQTTVPHRPEMINIIRRAFDRGVTFYDTAGLENIGADAVRWTPSELSELNGSVSAIGIRGARLPDQVLVFSGVEAPAKK